MLYELTSITTLQNVPVIEIFNPSRVPIRSPQYIRTDAPHKYTEHPLARQVVIHLLYREDEEEEDAEDARNIMLSSSDYMHYHYLWWCHRRHYLKLRRQKWGLTLLALGLVTLGTILGPTLNNVWILTALTVLATVIKDFLDIRRFDMAIEMSRFAYTTYAKFLTPHSEVSTEELIWTHHLLIDIVPLIPDRIREQYKDLDPSTFTMDWVDGIKETSNIKPNDSHHGSTTTTTSD